MRKVALSVLVALISALLIALTGMSVAAEDVDTPVITVDQKSAIAGSTVEVAVTIKNNPGILGMTLKLVYDDALVLTAIESGEVMSKHTFTTPGEFHSGISLPWDAEKINPDDVKDGTVVTFTFEVKEDAEVGKNAGITVSYVAGAIIDNDLKPVSPEVISGGVEIIDYIPGDVNGDGDVNSTDVVYLRRFIAGGYGVTINEKAADVNVDNDINTTDVVYIRRFVAGGYGVVLLPSHTHVAGEFVIENEIKPTCEKDGCYDEVVYCSVCSTEMSRKTVVVAGGHAFDFSAPVADSLPSCNKYGFWFYGCKVCGMPAEDDGNPPADRPIPSDAPAGSEWVANGVLRLPMLSHKWALDAEDERNAEGNCVDPKVEVYKCSCGAENIKALDPSGIHEWDPAKTVITTPPTCTDSGIALYFCARCEEVQERAVDALGHELEYFMSKAPGCDYDGYIEHWMCLVCSKYFCDKSATEAVELEDILIPASGHELSHTVANDATCTTNGNIAYWYCNACGRYYSDADAKIEIREVDTVIWASGHQTIFVEAVPATCTEAGNLCYWQCSLCFEIYLDQDLDHPVSIDDVIVEPLGHTAKHYPEVPPSCEEYGRMEHWGCTECGKCFAEEGCVIEIDVLDTYISPMGHEIFLVSANDATCTEAGNREYWYCNVCHGYFDDPDALFAISAVDVVIPAHGHRTVAVAAIDPTCTEAGNIGYWRCVFCDGCFTDSSAMNAISEDSTVIPATGHTYSDKWQFDDTHHYHLAICGCVAEANRTKHTLDSNGCCLVCDYETKIKLETPVITSVEYDKVSWSKVENATSYTVIVNSDYVYTTKGLTAYLADVSYDGRKITSVGTVSIEVRANGEGRYLTSADSSSYSYYYVPEKTDLTSDEAGLTHKGIGYGYNLIENEAINGEKISKNKILNINKPLTIGEYYNPSITSGCFDSYHYSSVDELMAHFEGSVTANGGINFANIAKIKVNYDYSTSSSYSKYQYNEVLMLQDSILYKTYGIKDYNDEDLKHCLTEGFLEDIKLAASMDRRAWNEYMYAKYGTHVILGVATGGTYTAQYVISTNRSDHAESVKQAFSVGATDISLYGKLLTADLGIGVTMGSENSWSSSETEAHFNIFWTGSIGGGTTSPNNIDSAITKFETGLNESNAVVVRFTTDGAMSLGSLIAMVDKDLGLEFENYVSSEADAEYKRLYSQYTKISTLPVNVETVNGENVLHVDLSSYQKEGTLVSANNANFLNGILTVYPKMMGYPIDKIVIDGAFDEYGKLIDKFSIRLADSWDRDVTVILNNVGVVSADGNGVVDASEVGDNCNLTIEYNGINAISKQGGRIEFYSSVNSSDCKFELVIGENETIDFAMLQNNTTIRLPIAYKDGYDFKGWYNSNGEKIADESGYLLVPCNNVTLYAKHIAVISGRKELLGSEEGLIGEITFTPLSDKVTLSAKSISASINLTYMYLEMGQMPQTITWNGVPNISFSVYQNGSLLASGSSLDGRVIDVQAGEQVSIMVFVSFGADVPTPPANTINKIIVLSCTIDYEVYL